MTQAAVRDLKAHLEAHGLRIEGDESMDDLLEAHGYLHDGEPHFG